MARPPQPQVLPITAALPAAAAAVARGAVLAIPTESSYGLAVDPRNAWAVERVYGLKGRDAGKPLPVVIAGVEQLAALGIDAGTPWAVRVAALWPAPLTAVLPLAEGAPDVPAAAGARTLAVRVPAHDGLRALLAATGPLTATSANLSGEPPVLDAADAAYLLGAEPVGAGTEGGWLVVDGGRLAGGPPSTLVAPGASGEVLVLRAGSFPAERLAALEGWELES